MRKLNKDSMSPIKDNKPTSSNAWLMLLVAFAGIGLDWMK